MDNRAEKGVRDRVARSLVIVVVGAILVAVFLSKGAYVPAVLLGGVVIYSLVRLITTELPAYRQRDASVSLPELGTGKPDRWVAQHPVWSGIIGVLVFGVVVFGVGTSFAHNIAIVAVVSAAWF